MEAADREDRLRGTLIVRERAKRGGFSGASHLANQTGVERQAAADGAAACAALGLDDQFAVV